jgi:hypothetical protein
MKLLAASSLALLLSLTAVAFVPTASAGPPNATCLEFDDGYYYCAVLAGGGHTCVGYFEYVYGGGHDTCVVGVSGSVGGPLALCVLSYNWDCIPLTAPPA